MIAVASRPRVSSDKMRQPGRIFAAIARDPGAVARDISPE